jgi:hypothetical protein
VTSLRTLAFPACLAIACSATQARAQTTDRASLDLHASYFTQARSFALSHRVKPGVRLAWQRELWPKLHVGPALGGVVTGNENYFVSGVYALANYSAVESPSFVFEVLLGLGAGYNAPILHGDLKAGFPLVPYAYVGLLGGLRVSQTWVLGLELGGEQITVVDLGLTLHHEY